MQRRRILQGGLGGAALAFFGAPALTRIGEAVAQGFPPAPSFLPVPAIFVDEVRVPQGYSAQVLYSWGDPTGINGHMPPFQASGGVSVNSAADQAFQAGMDHDGMHYFPLPGNPRGNAGLLCINHENIQHPGEGGATNPTTFSTWPNGLTPARSSTIVITKDDGGVIGT